MADGSAGRVRCVSIILIFILLGLLEAPNKTNAAAPIFVVLFIDKRSKDYQVVLEKDGSVVI